MTSSLFIPRYIPILSIAAGLWYSGGFAIVVGAPFRPVRSRDLPHRAPRAQGEQMYLVPRRWYGCLDGQ